MKQPKFKFGDILESKLPANVSVGSYIPPFIVGQIDRKLTLERFRYSYSDSDYWYDEDELCLRTEPDEKKRIFYPGNVVIGTRCGCVVAVTAEEGDGDGYFSGILIKQAKCYSLIGLGGKSGGWSKSDFTEADIKVSDHDETIFFPGNTVIHPKSGDIVVVTKEESESENNFSGILIKEIVECWSTKIGREDDDWIKSSFRNAHVDFIRKGEL